MEPKALPPAKINPVKLLGGSSSAITVKKISVKSIAGGDRSVELGIIKKQVIKINDLVKTNTLLKAKEEEKKRKLAEQKRFGEKEQKLEEPTGKENKIPSLPALPKLGFLDRIKSFLFNIFLGYISLRLLPYLPKLAGVVDTIVKVQDTIIDISGKILNGLVSFVDKAYEVHDKTRKFLGNLGGENFTKAFDGFIGAMDKVIEASIIAAIAFGELRDTGGGSGAGGECDCGSTKASTAASAYEMSRAGKSYAAMMAERNLPKWVQRQLGGSASRFAESNLRIAFGKGNVGDYVRILTQGKLGKGALSKALMTVVRPRLSMIPFGIGALIDFGLSWALGEKPGRAAFRAIGSGILSWVGTALGGGIGLAGGPLSIAGAIIGGAAGGTVGDKLGGLLYDLIFGNKKPPKQQKVQGRAGGGPITRSGRPSGPARRTVQKPKAKRTLKVQTTEVKPGQSVGGKNVIEKVFPEVETKEKGKTVNPLGYMKSSYKIGSSIPGFGGLDAIFMKARLGENPSGADYQRAADGLSAWMQRVYGGGIQRTGAFAEGGSVDVSMFNDDIGMRNMLVKALQDTVAPKVDEMINDLKKQLGLKGIEGKKEEKPTTEPTDGEISGLQGNAKEFYDYLVSKGLSPNNAMGLVLNAARETGFNYADQHIDTNGLPVGGVFQWNGPRFTNLQKEIPDWKTNWKGQLDYALRENNLSKQYLTMKFNSPLDAANWWMREWERPANPALDEAKHKKIYDQWVAQGMKQGQGPPATLGGMPGNLSAAQQLASQFGLTMTSFNTGEHAKGSLHYQNRAMDFSNGIDTPQQKAFANSVISKYGTSIAELIYTPLGYGIKNGKQVPLSTWGDSVNRQHWNHVHVAFSKGGKVRGFTRAILGEKGPEFVIDADSTKALEDNFPGFLDALNKANYDGAIKVLRSYAEYEQGSTIHAVVDEKLIPVPIPVTSPQQPPIIISSGLGEIDDSMSFNYTR